MKRLTLACALLAALVFPAFAQEDDAEAVAIDFVVNNSIFVLFHEIGHMLIGELGIPVLGREEDAADNLAALLLIAAETEETDQALIDSADGWFLSDAANAAEVYEEAEFYDVHSLDVQRAYQVVCLMVGSNADIFEEVATNVGLDEERQESCEYDFVQVAQSWNAMLEPFIVPEGEAIPEVTIIYEPSEAYAGAAEVLQQSGLLEIGAEFVLTGYALPRPVTLRTTECGEANAFYDPEPGEITFCYELAEHFYTLFSEAEATAEVE